ncbi:hypothetical protein INT43_006081 [Umbelopsis isabellina]|uniref:Uncharacterized protein n=1 Tax=Mortierella isabellina TaxID=91625 RepID=A0A8H7PJ44_MORIS|nr:hypothetical protein INT43_006081 [Umbelopsis isabellina]
MVDRIRWKRIEVILLLIVIQCLLIVNCQQQPVEIDDATYLQLPTVTQTKIPKVVNFIILQDKPDKDMTMMAYLAVKSAHEMLKPEKIMLHYHNLPKGKWMDLARPFLTLKEVQIPKEIHGNPVNKVEHQSDVIRLQIMREFGGIYLDTDIISLKSIDHLLNETMVMGQQGYNLEDGLCSAVIMSRANSAFITRWSAAYNHFDDGKWDYHSVRVPGMLAKTFSYDIRVLPLESIFSPRFQDRQKEMYEGRVYDFANNLMVHLWGSASIEYLSLLSPEVIQNVDTSLNCAIRKFLPDTYRNVSEDRTCVYPKQTSLKDRLVGYWPLNGPSNAYNGVYERLEDLSGNGLHGFSKDGTYDTENPTTKMKLSKDNSFIKLPMLSGAKMDNLTVSWIMSFDENKSVSTDILVIESNTFTIRVAAAPNGLLIVNGDGFKSSSWMSAAPDNIFKDGQEHLYTLSINTDSKRIALYLDEIPLGSSNEWTPPGNLTTNKLTHLSFRGNQQMPITYRDVRIWNKEFEADAISKFVAVA